MISRTLLSSVVKKMRVKNAKTSPSDVKLPTTTEDSDFIPIGVHGLLSASEKLLAVNRGLDEPDERDSYLYKRIRGVDQHLGDRIRMDAGKVKRNAMWNAAKSKSLRNIYPGIFNPYTSGLVIGDPGDANPLSTPLEEINPMHIVEQARRISQMGQGGIGVSRAITEDAQNVHPSQFAFVCPISGPESERIGVDARLAHGVRVGTDGRLYQQFRNSRTGLIEWLSPEDVSSKVVRIPD